MAQALEQFVKKADYARMHGWHRSYVSKLQREGRIVLSADGRLVDWAATDQLIGNTSDPSKLGVTDRWSEHRQERDVRVELRPATATTTEPPPDEPKGSSSGSMGGSTRGFHYWREMREKELALAAQRERQKLDNELVDAAAVRHATGQLARQVRDRLLALPERIHLQVAFETDPMKVLTMLDAEIRDSLKQISTTILVPQGSVAQ
jgi:phage terminase Nu1 subunit (DNA packaging protein)